MIKSWLTGTFSKKCVLTASILSLTVQLLPAAPSLAFLKATNNTNSMQLPINSKLDEPANPAGPAASSQPSAPPDLSPMKLDDPQADNAQPSGGASGADTAGVLKSVVSTTDYVPKGPIDKGGPAVPTLSIKSSKSDDVSDKVLTNAKKMNVMPLALIESPDEAKAKDETTAEAEKAELTDLWDSTLTRSPDIQFVTQKLMPSTNSGQTTRVMMKFLSAAMFGAMGAVNMASPSMGMYAATSSGGNMVASVLGMADQNAAKKAKLSQTEAIMLYNIVRSTADHLVENYRNYKKVVVNLRTANNDLSDLQNMVKDAKAKDNAQSIEMEYTLRKAQRDIDSICEDVKKYRQGLVDLAGNEAVAKLDKQVEEEQSRLDPTAAVADQAQPADDKGKQLNAVPSDDKKIADQSQTKLADDKKAKLDSLAGIAVQSDAKPGNDKKKISAEPDSGL